MKDDESIQDMHTRFTSIINELHSLGETIPRNKLIRKILSVLPSSWESKVNAITEAKDLQSLTIDEFSLINDKDALTVELGEAEQTKDDLVIVVDDLKETIENLKKKKDALDERVSNIEHERDDLLVVVVDLKETIGEPKIESRTENSQKGKEVASEAHIKLEITNIVTGEVVLVAKRYKNIYVADFESLQNGDLNYLSAIDDDAELWHKRLGHASFTLLNKLVRKDLDETFEVFVAFVKRIQVKMGNNVLCIRSLLNKTPYELLNGRKPKLTHIRTFGCKCFVLINGKEALGKFDAKSDEGIFLGYSSQSKAYKDRRVDQDEEPLSVPGEVIGMENGKADMRSHVKESTKDDANTSSSIREEPGPTITTTKAENRVADAVQGTQLAEVRSGQEPQSDTPGSSTNEIRVPNWKHKSSHPLDNIITPLDSGVQTRSKTRNSVAFSTFLSQIEPKNIKEALKDADWITAMQDELHQFERNKAYVDDIIFGATTNSLCEEFAKLMGSEFKMSMMGELNFFLGLQVKQSQKGTSISQQKYFKELLKRFDMEESKVIDTPIATTTRLDMDELGSPGNHTMYRGIIGSLLYLNASRLDIVFSVGLCARFHSNPKESHLKVAKRIFRYPKGMQDLVLYYPSRYLVDRKSTSRMAHFLGSCLISWGTRKQNSVGLSTTEAEYVAAASCYAQSLWIKQQLEDFGVFSDCVPLLCDNTSAFNMAKNPVQHKRTKHIDVRHHFLRHNVEKGLICIKFCSTEDQIADIFTKALIREHFERNHLALGLINPN
ncbi:uncharacterized protein LOC142178201 [Nicotiana tabacum]|uniref:Uncharacterized protein LOC142178201 n=1 Tax=Nicotiana tabacum TaxID=4097 RepID=A0AC58U2B5_TOBAC